MKKILRKTKKYFKSKTIKASVCYTKYYEKSDIKEEVLFQSYDGSSISGNPYYLLLEMCRNAKYQHITKYVVANDISIREINKTIIDEKLKNVEVIKIHSKKYCKVLAEAKYLINNSTFPTYFIKKDGQIYLNTWHGTPLKAMGRDIIDSPHELGNTQRNFMMADYLLYQNDFMFEKMKSAYMLDNLYSGKYVISGYPRNDIFFNDNDRKNIKQELNIENKKVIVYMPTWRGTAANKQDRQQEEDIAKMIKKLEKELDENTIVYMKIHNLANAKIDYEKYKKIKPFPSEYETYRFLNVADCLITDYSSVMFDFANTGRKIILYTYDFEEYTKNRGFYIDMNDMPFTMAYNENELCNEIKNAKTENNYKEFQDEYCKYDSKETSKNICELLFDSNLSKLKIIDAKTYNNNKPNILIFTGALLKNGITASLKGLINNIDLTQYNYYLSFSRNAVRKNCQTISNFSRECNYIPIQGNKDYRVTEAIASLLYFELNIETKWIRKKINAIYTREVKRCFPNIKFKYGIDFCGYDRIAINLINYMDTIKIRYTHSDMAKEQKTRKNFHVPSLKHAYKTYDTIAVVREGMEKEVRTHFKGIQPKSIQIVHNVNDVENIIKGSKEEINFSENTYTNYPKEYIEKVLNDNNAIKFINIGRFSTEKGQDRLIRAFERIQKNRNNCYLFLIGGHGNQFDNIMNMLENKNIKNVIVIKNLENPYPILKKCNLFILSSLYEGLPMTIMESLILKVPILSVDIEGPRPFLQQGYANIVENSEDGLYDGMNKFINKQLPKTKEFDYNEFNKKAINEFYELLK